MPDYKLVYFNLMGRAEPIRLLFAQAAIPYEDERIERAAWPAIKPKMPFGQLPVLEVDGRVLSQSRAIERYLANTFGLAGTTDWDRAKVDELTQGVEDLLFKLDPWLNEKSETKKIEIFRGLVEGEIVPFLNRYERFLASNGSGYFVGKDLTQADLSLFHLFWFFNKLLPGSLRKYPQLYNFYCRISDMPKIKEWLDTRPKTEA